MAVSLAVDVADRVWPSNPSSTPGNFVRLPVVLRYLVFALPVLVVSFAVLMGACAIARLADDEVAEWVLNSAGVVALVLMAVDMILLVGVLGIKSLIDSDRQRNENQKKQRRKMRRRRRGRKHGRGRGPRGRDDSTDEPF